MGCDPHYLVPLPGRLDALWALLWAEGREVHAALTLPGPAPGASAGIIDLGPRHILRPEARGGPRFTLPLPCPLNGVWEGMWRSKGRVRVELEVPGPMAPGPHA